MTQDYDALVIGAGIAGMSVASALACAGQRVAVLEREPRPGRQATARAVSLLRPLHAEALLRDLTARSQPFFEADHPEIDARPLTCPRGLLMLARLDQADHLRHLRGLAPSDAPLRCLDADELRGQVPVLRPGYAERGLFDPRVRDLDVPLLMELHRRRLAAAGGALLCAAPVTGLRRSGGLWRVDSGAGPFAAQVLINAAGAWADKMARLAGIAPIGLRPWRRTVLQLQLAGGVTLADLPMVVDADLHFYLKPDQGRLLASPADEILVPDCQAEPEDLDVALCLDRIAACFDIEVAQVTRVWAGLRCYVPDRLPVCGWAPDAPGFFWLAGQGATGIQTSPALADLAVAQILGRTEGAEADLAAQLSPGRLGAA